MRQHFIKSDELLIIKMSWNEGRPVIAEVPIKQYSIDEVIEWVCTYDDTFEVLRVGSEGAESVTQELAKHYCQGKFQDDIPDYKWCKDQRDERPLMEDVPRFDPVKEYA